MIAGLDWKIGVIALEVVILVWGLWFFLGKPKLRNMPRTMVDKFLSVFRRQKTNNYVPGSQDTSVIESMVELMDKRLSVIEKNIIDVAGALKIKIVDEKPKSVFDELSRKNERKGLSDADKTLIGNGFDGLKKQVAQVSENLERTSQSYDVLLKAGQQTHMFSEIDKKFFTEKFSRLENQIDTAIKNALISNSQKEELDRILNLELDKFSQTLKDILDAQDLRLCPSCQNPAVPTNANFCPQCGNEFNKESAVETT